MRNLVILLSILIFIAAGIFFYQVSTEKKEVEVLPAHVPTSIPSKSVTVIPSSSLSPKPSMQPTKNPNANITVSSPVTNQTVSGSFTISGQARVFENVVSIRVTDQTTGKVLTQTTAYASAPDVGQFGPFALRFDIPDTVRSKDTLLVEVYQASPKDGSEVDKVSITVKVE
jgi:hypothetical protein